MYYKKISVVLGLFLFFQSFVSTAPSPIEEIRTNFEKGSESVAYAEKLKILTSTQKTPLLKAYYGMSYALMAKHSNSPFKKLELVKKGMNYINAAVTEEPQNIEIRFLRFSIESNAPSFLGISTHLSEDKNHLVNNLTSSHAYHKVIFDFLMKSPLLSEADKLKLRK
ncbi:MAG: hypothetical protein Q8K70_01035 [Bacteroidota bacterium]|nr:hypothetical protein [Bacteroidota bacterium]